MEIRTSKVPALALAAVLAATGAGGAPSTALAQTAESSASTGVNVKSNVNDAQSSSTVGTGSADSDSVSGSGQNNSGTNASSTTSKEQTAAQKKADADKKKQAAQLAALKKQAKLINAGKSVVYASRTVALKFPGKVSLAVRKASFSAAVRSAKSGSGVKQRFYLTRVSKKSSYMMVRSAATGQALQAKGSKVVQATTTKKKAQQWRLRYVKTKKSYVLQNRATGTYLTLSSNKAGRAFSLTAANKAGNKYFSLANRKAPAMLSKRLLQARINTATRAKKLKMIGTGYQLSASHKRS